ncbi:MAG: hypothetical protein LW704_03505 [Cryomorphaceae bacterium]|nr:hypothetical protein [Cryomorphaceae bacterium]
MSIKSFFIAGSIALLISSCANDPLDVDASDVKVNIGFVNMDSIWSKSDGRDFLKADADFRERIPEMYEYELGYCLRVGRISDTALINSLTQFKNDPFMSRVGKAIKREFKDLTSVKAELLDGFRHIKYHLPSAKLPSNIVFMNSVFTSSAFSSQKEIGIGLERYLGEKSPVIKDLPNDMFFGWIKEGMDRRYLVRDAFSSWIMTHYIQETDGNLAEQIIRWGKILYLTEAAIPDAPESIIPRYSEEDYKWALENEYSLWKYLVDQKMLFKIDELNKTNLLNEGPFTPGLPEKGPDRLGQFLGWRMVRKYMEVKDITVEELMTIPYTEIIVEYEID